MPLVSQSYSEPTTIAHSGFAASSHVTQGQKQVQASHTAQSSAEEKAEARPARAATYPDHHTGPGLHASGVKAGGCVIARYERRNCVEQTQRLQAYAILLLPMLR